MKNLKRSMRRYQAEVHMWRRLKQDRNQHNIEWSHRYPVLFHQDDEGIAWSGSTRIYFYNQAIELYKEDNVWVGLREICPCFTEPKTMARFKEQPKADTHCICCGNQRKYFGLTLQEQKAQLTYQEEMNEYYSCNL